MGLCKVSNRTGSVSQKEEEREREEWVGGWTLNFSGCLRFLYFRVFSEKEKEGRERVASKQRATTHQEFTGFKGTRLFYVYCYIFAPSLSLLHSGGFQNLPFFHLLAENMSRHPEIRWAQREDKVFITVLLSDAKHPKVNLEPDGVFTFSATAGAENLSYELKLDLYDKVNVEESKINIGPRSIFCILEKAESKWWSKLLRGDAKTPHYVKVDWDKWVDEDDDTGTNDLGMGEMDLSKFGDMGGMGGMPGMDDFMGDDLEDSDDEVQEGAKPDSNDTEEAGGETEPEVASEVKAEAPSST